MSDGGRPLDSQLVAYALDALEGSEREALERRLRDDAELRDRLAELTATTRLLGELPDTAWDRLEPSPHLDHSPHLDPQPHLEPPLQLDPPPVPASPPRSRARRRPPGSRPLIARLRRVPLAAAAALLVLGLLAGIAIGSSSSSAPSIVATADLLPIDGSSPAAHAVFRMAANQTATLDVDGLPPTNRGHVYELWLMDSVSDLVAVASFRVGQSGHAVLTVPLPTAPSHFRYLDVSLQPLHGSAVHAATSVLRGRTP